MSVVVKAPEKFMKGTVNYHMTYNGGFSEFGKVLLTTSKSLRGKEE